MVDKFLIFDVDGTLNQTELYAVESYQKALLKRKIVVDNARIISCIGMNPKQIFRELVGSTNEDKYKEWEKEIKVNESNLLLKKAKPFEGIKETLNTLKMDGYRLAICSNAYRKNIEIVLEVLGLSDFFETIASLEMGNNKTKSLRNLLEKLKPEMACMIGDRKFDLDAARSNGIWFIGCEYGYAPTEILNANYVVQNPKDIIKAVHTLFNMKEGL